jgi:hypothetical protein
MTGYGGNRSGKKISVASLVPSSAVTKMLVWADAGAALNRTTHNTTNETMAGNFGEQRWIGRRILSSIDSES